MRIVSSVKRFTHHPLRQQGVAILTVTTVLFVVSLLAALAIARAGLYEQKLTALDARSKEVYAVARGGLEYAVAWLMQPGHLAALEFDRVPNGGLNSERNPVSGSEAVLAGTDLPPATSLVADRYQYSIRYRLLTDPQPTQSPVAIRVLATAQAESDSHVRKTISIDMMRVKVPLFSSLMTLSGDPQRVQAPPLLVEHCLASRADLSADQVTLNTQWAGRSPAAAIAIATTAGLAGTASEHCLPITASSSNANPLIKGQLSRPLPLWQAVFGGTTVTDLAGMATRYPERVLIINTVAELAAYGSQLGSAQAPVVVYFGPGLCPQLAGRYRIEGLVYVANTDPACLLSGWGDVTIHGVLAKAGSLGSLSSGINIHQTPLDFSRGEADSPVLGPFAERFPYIARLWLIPGSWKDF